MSQWIKAKLGLKCSVNILHKAILKIMPECKKHIQIDLNGNLPIYNYRGTLKRNKCHIVIPRASNHTKLNYNNIGFRQDDKGSWIIEGDNSDLKGVLSNLSENLIKEIAVMKIIAIAQQRGDLIVSDEIDGEDRVVITRTSVNDSYLN